MNTQARITPSDLLMKKQQKSKIVTATAYDFTTAKIANQYCDMILVGDSLGMVVYGMENTIGVTLDMMINHTKAVVKAANRSLIVVDMPFGTYEESPQQAYRHACTILIESGCQAVKIEGGTHMAETIDFLTNRGIPVLAHIGMTPQHIHQYGGFKVQGRDNDSNQKIKDDSKAVTDAGAFAVVIEAIPISLADYITHDITIPTIGIGAGLDCDGQILVTADLIGYHDGKYPKFSRKFAHINTDIHRAFADYATAVKNSDFPNKDETY